MRPKSLYQKKRNCVVVEYSWQHPRHEAHSEDPVTTLTKIAFPQINCNVKETLCRLHEKECAM